MKLFEVTTKAYVLAQDEEAALDILKNEGELSFDPASKVETFEAYAVDADWYFLRPFSDGSDERTCGEIIKVSRTKSVEG